MSRTRAPRHPRRARLAASAVALAGAAALTGCASQSQQTTDLAYDASDGVSGSTGDVDLTNVLLVTEGTGTTAHLDGMVENTSDRNVSLTVSSSGATTRKVTLPPGQTVRLDGKSDGNTTSRIPAVRLDGVKGSPGDTVNVQFTASPGRASTLQVPLLLDQYPYGSASEPHATAPGGDEGGH